MKKSNTLFNRICSLLLALVIMSLCLETSFIRTGNLSVFAADTYSIGPASNSLTLTISNTFKISYSGSTDMFDGCTQAGGSGSGAKTFKIKENIHTSQRTGYIDVKYSNGTLCKRYTVIQDGVYLDVVPSKVTSTISPKGETIDYTITSNKAVKVTKFGNNINDAVISNRGSDQTTAGSKFTYTLSVYYGPFSGKGTNYTGIRVEVNKQSWTRNYAQSNQNESHTHKFGPEKIIKEATCKSTGLKEKKCSICGHTETTTIPKKTHDYVLQKTQKSTCTECGIKYYQCSMCGNEYSETYSKPSGHDVNYYYNGLTKRINADCTRCDLCDNDVTYKDYLSYENYDDNEASQIKYLDMVYNGFGILPERVDVSKFIQAKKSVGCPKLAALLLRVSSLTGMGVGVSQNGLNAIRDNEEVYAIISLSGNAGKSMANTCKYLGYASIGECVIGRITDGEWTPGDAVAIFTAFAGVCDEFGVLSQTWSGMPDLIDNTYRAVDNHYKDVFLAMAQDEYITTDLGEKSWTDLDLYEVVRYKAPIKFVISEMYNNNTKTTNKLYDYLLNSKMSYIGYIIQNPNYNDNYVNFCKYVLPDLS